MELPCFAYIDEYLGLSSMANKDMVDISVNPEQRWLKVWFDPELSVADKALFDTIVADSLGKISVKKSREAIMAEILTAASSDQEQMGRLLDALDDYTSMSIALDGRNYALARSRVQKVYLDGKITEADRDLVLACIPADSYVLEN
ncbi:MAG: hypothetical protein DRP01_00115 [Archaeoglobales archaeon]|nr:MAG: hypothetical protein DRP01_00115 [Archaeoglobales archaeon]